MRRAVAILFAREGADVAIVYLDEREDAAITKRQVEAEGRRCLLMAGDVSKQGFCNRAVARAVREFGRLDILVNNFLASSQCSSYITGEVLPIIGGYTGG